MDWPLAADHPLPDTAPPWCETICGPRPPTGLARPTARDLEIHAGHPHAHRTIRTLAPSGYFFMATDIRRAHLDAYLSEGPTTRNTIRNFIQWRTRAGIATPFKTPYRTARTTPLAS